MSVVKLLKKKVVILLVLVVFGAAALWIGTTMVPGGSVSGFY